MITVNTDPLNQAIQRHPQSLRVMAVHAGLTEETLNKVCAGEESVILYNYGKLADYLGYDVVVSFKKKAAEPAPA
jgi:hypothetical protein